MKKDIKKELKRKKAIKEIERLNVDKLKYEILIVKRDEIGFENINRIKEAIYGYGGKNVRV